MMRTPKRPWGKIASAAGVAAGILAGTVTVASYIGDTRAKQTEQEQHWAASQAVTQDKIDDLESDVSWLRDQHESDLKLIAEECRP
ncbi:MAG: hypothetical protein ACRESI_00490 [Gammaproteobacteria bacterium]